MKIHMVDKEIKEEDINNSPHIIRAIRNSNLALCRLITERITDDIDEVTCKECLKIYDNLKSI